MRVFTPLRLLLALALCGLAAAIAFFPAGKGGNPRDKDGMAQPVRAARAVTQDVPEYLSGLGTVQPSSDALVRSRVDGVLLRLHFTEGQHVREGDLLAEIDPRPFEADLAEARGTLMKDQAQLDNARLDLARYAKLSQNKYIAAQEYNTQQAKVREYEGIVAADKAKVRSAELQLTYSRITAPVGGKLGLRQVEVGNMVHSSDAAGIVRISEIQPCHVVFSLPESKLNVVLQGAKQRGDTPMTVQAWDREEAALLGMGTLISMDNVIDTATGTVKFKAEFANTDRLLFPNQFINARLHARTFLNAVTVPAAAVQLGIKGKYVFLIREKKVHMVNVTVPFSNDDLAVITQGVKADDVVVVVGVDRLREGAPVDVVAMMETPRALPPQDGDEIPAAAKPAAPAAR